MFAETYKRYIEACFRNDAQAASYYQPLIDHVTSRRAGVKSLQSSLKAYDIDNSIIRVPSAGTDVHRNFLVEVDIEAPPKSARIYVLEGHACPEAVSFLGATFSIRPELFIGHLDLSLGETSQRKYFELPALPSRREGVMHIRMIAIGRSLLIRPRTLNMSSSRIHSAQATAMYNKNVIKHQQYGATRFRSVDLHDDEFFTVEQVISCTVARDHEKWTGIFMLDSGFDGGERLKHVVNPPWAQYVQPGQMPSAVPIIPYACYGAERNVEQEPQLIPEDHNSVNVVSPLTTYHPIKSLMLDSPAKLVQLEQDPFFLIGQVLLRAALAWNQAIGMVEDNIAVCRTALENNIPEALEQLRFNTSFISHVQACLRQNSRVIDNQWLLQCYEPEKPWIRNHTTDLRRLLRADYDFLMTRCEVLTREAGVSSSFLLRTMEQIQTRKAIEQSEKIQSLTTLAYLFIPISLAAGIFGMNIEEFQPVPPSVWKFVTTALCLSLLGLFAAFWVQTTKWLESVPTSLKMLWAKTVRYFN